MLNDGIVLILGAGASKPFGFPLGIELVDMVCADDPHMMSALTAEGFDPPDVVEFRDALRESMSKSVDAFLERRRDFDKIGKLAMAYFLIQQEDATNVFDDWYRYLFDLMAAPTAAQFSENELGVITFNYDRSFEYCFGVASRRNYDLTLDDLPNVEVIHLHGQLGTLAEHPSAGRPYDTKVNPTALRSAAEGIRVMHDDDDSEQLEAAHEMLSTAKRVYLMGFGFHPRNIDRLQLDQHCPSAKYGGTAYGHTDAERKRLVRRMPKPFDEIMRYENETVLGYMRNHVASFAQD